MSKFISQRVLTEETILILIFEKVMFNINRKEMPIRIKNLLNPYLKLWTKRLNNLDNHINGYY